MMELTQQNVSTINEIIGKIRAEELRAKNLCIKLNKQLKEMVENREISDFEFDFSFCVWSSDDEFNKKHHTETGDPYYEQKYAILHWDDDEFFNTNWNQDEWEDKSPLKDFHFCYSAHCLFFHTDLSIEDIMAMEEFWFEVKVDFQFFTDFSRNKKNN